MYFPALGGCAKAGRVLLSTSDWWQHPIARAVQRKGEASSGFGRLSFKSDSCPIPLKGTQEEAI